MSKTPEIRESEIKGFVRAQTTQGGIIPSKLKHGTKIILETIQFMYALDVLDTPKGRRYILETASQTCLGNYTVINIESHSTKLKHNMEDWVGKDMRVIFKFANGNSVMIGDIKGAMVVGENESYTYNFWEN